MNCMGDMGELTECLVMARDSSKNLADEIDALVAISRAGHGQDDKHESEYESPGMSPSQILITLLENHMTDISNLHELLEAERNAAALEIDEEKFEALTSRLSEKDKELARFMLLGGTNKAIIETLPYSPKYVSKLTKKIIHTIGVKNRAEFREIVLKIKH
jgi:DNA-binding CsgD family transcriptional regulator